MENFYMENELGVSIEYTIVGHLEDEGVKYIIYTDFVEATEDEQKQTPSDIRLFVGKEEDGQIISVNDDKRDVILGEMFRIISEQLGM